MAAEVFRHPHRVTCAECTIGDHVYHARYLDMLEAARGELFRHLGAPFRHWQRAGFAFPVVECRLRYRKAARYDDLLTVEVWLTELARIRLGFGYRIVNDSRQQILEASTVHACASAQDKLMRLPEALTELRRPYLHAVSERRRR